jgi:F420H(2)-dependent quinone reductase
MPLEGEYEPSPRAWVRDQVERYEATGGREANTLRDTGLPVVIYSTRGAKSGKVRKQPLMRVEHGGVYAMVGSQGGAPTDPAWVHNLRAAPDQVSVQDGPEPWDGVAREITGDEKQTWWQRAVSAYPPYADYQRKTDREIPVFLVERGPDGGRGEAERNVGG